MIKLIKREELIKLGNYSAIIEKLERIAHDTVLSNKEVRQIISLKIEFAYEFGKVDECLEYGKNFFTLIETENELTADDFYVYYYLIETYSLLLSMNKKSSELLQSFEKNMKKILPEFQAEVKAIYYLCKSLLVLYSDLDLALSLINQAFSFINNQKEKKIYAFLKYRYGKIHLQAGNLSESLVCFEESLVCGELFGSMHLANNSLISMGEIYRLKGNLGKALELYNDALINYQETENIYGIAHVFNNIGIIYFSKGDSNFALDFFEKSLNYAKMIHFNYIIAESTYYLVKLFIFRGELSKAKNYLENLQTLCKKEKNNFLKFYSHLTEAIILKEIKRFETQARASILLRSIIKKNTVYNELNIHAFLNLTELLVEELKLFNQSDIVKELEKLCDMLLKIAQKQISRSLLAEVYWLKAKIYLIQGQIDAAQEHLLKAQKAASSQELENLVYRIKKEYDLLVQEQSRWKSILNSDITLSKRIEKAKVDTFVSQMIQRFSYELETLETDTPVMLLILNETGLPLYSYNFSQAKYDSILFSGFLSALNNILKEVLATEGTIKQIEYHDYFIIFKNSDGIIFAYVFKGSSFSANKKMSRLVEEITKEKSIWSGLLNFAKTGKFISKDEEKKLETLIHKSLLRKSSVLA